MKKLPQKYLIKGIKDNAHTQITLLATSIESAREQSLKHHIYPIEIKPLSHFEFLHLQILRLDNAITAQDKSALFLQISIMLNAKLPILEVIEVCAKNTKKPPLKRILLEIAYRLNLGQKLSVAFKEFAHIFGDMVWSMIALGERSGELGEIFTMLSTHLAREHKNRTRLKRALFYPLIVLLGIIVAFVAIVGFVLPQFMELFSTSNITLPIYTRLLLYAQGFFEHYGLWLCALLLVSLLLALRLYKKSPALKRKIHTLALHLPFVGEIVRLHLYYRYTFTLFLQLKSATPLDLALALSNDTLGNLTLKARFGGVLAAINNGKSLSLALAEAQLLDDISLALIAAGEQSGKLPDMLEVCAQRFQELSQEKIDFLISLVEPLLSLLMGGLLLLLALGVFVPMWDMSANAF